MSARFPDAHALPSPAAPLADAAGTLAGRARRRFTIHVRRGTLGLTLLAVILGMFLAAQWQSRPRPAAAVDNRREVAQATIQRLEAEQGDLKRRIAELRAQLDANQQAMPRGEADLARLNAELDAEKLMAGTVALRGPGVRIVLDDSAVKTIPAKEDPAMYIVHEYQLRDIVNVLWAAGAEGIAINGERVVAPTSIYCVGSTILVNDVRTSPPYEFLVIGDQARLEAALGDPANLRALKSRIKLYGLQLNVQKTRDLLLPAYTGGLDVRHVALAPEAALRSARGGER